MGRDFSVEPKRDPLPPYPKLLLTFNPLHLVWSAAGRRQLQQPNCGNPVEHSQNIGFLVEHDSALALL
jgi:hypothetical protein